MKTLVAIYAVAIISGITAVSYANAVINGLVVQPLAAAPTLSVQPLSHTARLVVTPEVQGGKVTTTAAIQGGSPKMSQRLQNANIQIQGKQNAADTLQPALGYGALGWTMQ